MEKKTMGAFIATMRKAKGMTQLQLADRLGVSNKTISHWECDESAPDLSMLPELADIFGITCDELLRGELNTVKSVLTETQPGVIDEDKKIKSEKTHLNTNLIISVGLEALAALVMWFIPNIKFKLLDYNSTNMLALFISGVLLVASLVVSLVALNKVSNNVSANDSQAVNNIKHHMYKIRFVAISMFIAGILFCFVYQYLNLVVTGVYIVISALVYFLKFRKRQTKKDKSFENEKKAN